MILVPVCIRFNSSVLQIFFGGRHQWKGGFESARSVKVGLEFAQAFLDFGDQVESADFKPFVEQGKVMHALHQFHLDLPVFGSAGQVVLFIRVIDAVKEFIEVDEGVGGKTELLGFNDPHAIRYFYKIVFTPGVILLRIDQGPGHADYRIVNACYLKNRGWNVNVVGQDVGTGSGGELGVVGHDQRDIQLTAVSERALFFKVEIPAQVSVVSGKEDGCFPEP